MCALSLEQLPCCTESNRIKSSFFFGGGGRFHVASISWVSRHEPNRKRSQRVLNHGPNIATIMSIQAAGSLRPIHAHVDTDSQGEIMSPGRVPCRVSSCTRPTYPNHLTALSLSHTTSPPPDKTCGSDSNYPYSTVHYMYFTRTTKDLLLA